MPLDPRVQRFLSMFAAVETASQVRDVASRRHGFRALMQQAGALSEAVPFRDVTVPGAEGALPARLYAPGGLDAAPGPGLLFFHGGGFVSGDLDTHDGICRQLAASSRCRILSVAYRLAPEHPFPAAAHDARAAAAAVLGRASTYGLDPERLAIGGDSVGAALAALVTHATCPESGGFAAQVLICPVLDAGEGGPSREIYGSGYFLDLDTMRRDRALYGVDIADAGDPRVSPVRAPDLAGLPAAIIHTAEFDPVRDDGENYAARLDAAGVSVRLTRHPGMIHLFYGFGRLIPQGTAALKAIGAELATVLSGGVEAS